ncbi:hypothetical protein CPB86DRAFT_785601 [Serendipita vermifera]|nr:hypothetical protein CPB86DRAFT_785601 [Serendipita vermifera]
MSRFCTAKQTTFGTENTKTQVVADEDRLRNATDNLIFTTVASFLQQWPNTRYRNGHAIIKGTIPVGTVMHVMLYHGRPNSNLPLEPEWLAFNVEHSYLLCFPPECWMLTLEVEEELNILYFDGSSAANSKMGHQDSQDVVLWGKPRPDMVWKEWERIKETCEWGEPFGIDGFVREVMLCDFTKKVKLVSTLHIMACSRPTHLDQDFIPYADTFLERQRIRFERPISTARDSNSTLNDGPEKPPPHLPQRLPRPSQPLPPHWSGSIRDGDSVRIEALLAAAWNSFQPGEARVKLDYSRLVSFYDPTFTSLIDAREGLDRHHHRLTNLSHTDYLVAMAQLHDALTRETPKSSGIDWSTLTRSVTDRYGDRLYLLNSTLHTEPTNTVNATSIAARVRSQLMVMLMPSMIYGVVPDGDEGSGTSWVEPIREHCATWMTKLIKEDALTRSERMIKIATEGVLSRICSTITNLWKDALSVESVPEDQASLLLEAWRNELDKLMMWLDWPIWDTCHPACPDDMFCYIPTWPWGIRWMDDDTGIDMTPRCVSRFQAMPRRS